MIVFESRASTILYNFLRSRRDRRPFLLPANVCPIVPITFLKARHDFRVVDMASDLQAPDPEQCLDLVERQRGAFGGVLHVRTYGAEGTGEAFMQAVKAAQPDLTVVDDRCLCRPDVSGASLSPAADVTLFSTGRSKPVDLGFGGFAHVRAGVAYRRGRGTYRAAELARITRRYQAAIAARRPFRGGAGAWLDLARPRISWEAYGRRVTSGRVAGDLHRTALNAIYERALPAEVQLGARFQGWRFNITVPNPDRLVSRLSAAGLFAGRHYASLGGILGSGHFPVAEALHARVVNLFNDGRYDEAMACRTAALVNEHLEATV
jgi:hypothetical protein